MNKAERAGVAVGALVVADVAVTLGEKALVESGNLTQPVFGGNWLLAEQLPRAAEMSHLGAAELAGMLAAIAVFSFVDAKKKGG